MNHSHDEQEERRTLGLASHLQFNHGCVYWTSQIVQSPNCCCRAMLKRREAECDRERERVQHPCKGWLWLWAKIGSALSAALLSSRNRVSAYTHKRPFGIRQAGTSTRPSFATATATDRQAGSSQSHSLSRSTVRGVVHYTTASCSPCHFGRVVLLLFHPPILLPSSHNIVYTLPLRGQPSAAIVPRCSPHHASERKGWQGKVRLCPANGLVVRVLSLSLFPVAKVSPGHCPSAA